MQHDVGTFINQLLTTPEGEVPNLGIDRDTFASSVWHETFRVLCARLSDTELDALTRRLCILETLPTIGQMGSTSRIHIPVRILEERRYKALEELLDWLLAHRTNSYIPFGTTVPLSVRSYQDYIEYQRRREAHRREMRERDEEEHQKALARKEAKRIAHEKVREKKALQYAAKILS